MSYYNSLAKLLGKYEPRASSNKDYFGMLGDLGITPRFSSEGASSMYHPVRRMENHSEGHGC